MDATGPKTAISPDCSPIFTTPLAVLDHGATPSLKAPRECGGSIFVFHFAADTVRDLSHILDIVIISIIIIIIIIIVEEPLQAALKG